MGGECVVVEAFQIKPVSTANSLLTGKLTGNFADSDLLWLQKFPVRLRREFVCKPLNQMND